MRHQILGGEGERNGDETPGTVHTNFSPVPCLTGCKPLPSPRSALQKTSISSSGFTAIPDEETKYRGGEGYDSVHFISEVRRPLVQATRSRQGGEERGVLNAQRMADGFGGQLWEDTIRERRLELEQMQVNRGRGQLPKCRFPPCRRTATIGRP